MRVFAFARLMATFFAIAFFAVPVAAVVDTSLWGIVSPNIPDDAKAVLYLDGASLKSSELLRQLKPTLFGLEHGAANDVERICSVDLVASVQNALLVIAHDETPNVYVETAGLDKKRITACIKALATRAHEHEKVTVTSKGSIVQVAIGSRNYYFGWTNNKVLVLAGSLDDRNRLSKALMKAKKRFDAQPNVTAALAKLNRAATLWGLFNDPPTSRESEKPEQLFGVLNVVTGKVTAEVRAVFTSDQKASTAEQSSNRGLADAKKEVGKLGSAGPAASRILGGVKIVRTANEVVGTAAVAQSDVIDVVQAVVPNN